MFIRSTSAGERLGGLAWATRAAAHALAAAFDVVVIETVGVGQAETEVADVADTVAVVVQPGSGDVLQFLKSGIMEIPDVLVVTKADLGQIALRTRRDVSAALRSLGSSETPRRGRLLALAAAGDRGADRGAATSIVRTSTCASAGCGLGEPMRWPTSRTSTASAGCARSAAAMQPSGCSPHRIQSSTPPRWWPRSSKAPGDEQALRAGGPPGTGG